LIVEDDVDSISILIFKDPISETDFSRKTHKPARRDQKKRVSAMLRLGGGEWECAAAGHLQGQQLDRSLQQQTTTV